MSTRDFLAAFYNWQQDDWDGSWGWSKYNDPEPYRWEFGKMMSAGDLLYAGITDDLTEQGRWSADTPVLSTFAAGVPLPTLSAVAVGPDDVALFYRDDQRRLTELLFRDTPWHPGRFPSSITRTTVSAVVATGKNDFRIDGQPVAVRTQDGEVHVFARSGNQLLYFRRSAAGQWSAESLTERLSRPTPVNGSDRFFIARDPVVVSHGVKGLEVFATDNFAHVVRYSNDNGAGWFGQDLTHGTAVTNRVRSALSVRVASGELGVFGINFDGHLLHFYQVPNAAGWAAEDVSARTASSKRLEGVVAPVSGGAGSWLVFARSSGEEFVMFFGAPSLSWIEFDVTQLTGSITGDPVAIGTGAHLFDVFVPGLKDNLIHFYIGEDGFQSEDLSARLAQYGPQYPVGGRLAVLQGGNNRIDVFGRSPIGTLSHYFWTSDHGWRVENIHAGAGVQSNWHKIGDSPVVVQRRPDALDVFANRPTAGLAVHFVAHIDKSLGSWHTNSEYRKWAAGSLRGFKYIPEDKHEGNFANALRGAFVSDRVSMQCPVFEDVGTALRAGTMLHEATHMIFWRYPHFSNAPSSACDDPCSDEWFFHGARESAGYLLLIAATKNHSMNQVQIEYLCDVSEFPNPNWPLAVTDGALTEADDRMTNRILNPPGWTCGVPRPLP